MMLWRHSPGICNGRRDSHFLFAHLIAEVLDVLALVAIAVGFGKRVVTGITPVVSGTAQHR
ncbi:MAG TPA: hypothetical protein VN513_16450 [Gemmatimonadales bacterium]|nr:hypothetical protein [Gemmatimonadales bacterium]